MRVVFASTAIFLIVGLTGQALSATVNTTGGQVLLNRGDGYKIVGGSAQGEAGDTVVANPGGGAQIVYADGCVVDVTPGTVTTIAAQSPCVAGSSGPSATTFAIGAVIVGGGVGAALLLQKDKSASP